MNEDDVGEGSYLAAILAIVCFVAFAGLLMAGNLYLWTPK